MPCMTLDSSVGSYRVQSRFPHCNILSGTNSEHSVITEPTHSPKGCGVIVCPIESDAMFYGYVLREFCDNTIRTRFPEGIITIQ